MAGTIKAAAGKDAVLFSMTKGSLVVGNGVLTLANNTWHLINAKANAGSQFTLPAGYIFKTPEVAHVITPIAGDDSYPLTLTKICKVNVSMQASKGSIDTTDDCANGYNEYITDGYTDISGSLSGFLKFNDPTGGIATGQLDILKRFFDVVADDGIGGYVLTAKNDTDLLLGILQNKNFDTVSVDTVTYLMMPVILEGLTIGKDLKAGQSFDCTFKKGEGPACFYERDLNATDTITF